jgi:hypothetical protein
MEEQRHAHSASSPGRYTLETRARGGQMGLRASLDAMHKRQFSSASKRNQTPHSCNP